MALYYRPVVPDIFARCVGLISSAWVQSAEVCLDFPYFFLSVHRGNRQSVYQSFSSVIGFRPRRNYTVASNAYYDGAVIV